MVMQVSQHIESGRVVQAVSETQAPWNALGISPLGHQEASALMAEEAKRTLALFEILSGEAWSQPTACTLWNVHQVASHLVGESAGYATWREFFRQYINPLNKHKYFRTGMGVLDALNQLMVDDRAESTPADLIEELREAAPKAIKTRLHLPAFLRAIVIPMPALGTVRIDYLTDSIYPRDTWMHRVDISRAAGCDIVLDAKHDARIVALVIRELAQSLVPHMDGQSVILSLNTLAGGEWYIGTTPQAVVRIDIGLIDFMLLASGRIKPEEAIARAIIEGDQQLGRWVIEKTTVPF